MASFLASYGSLGVSHAIWWCHAVTGWSPGIARGLPGCNRAQNEGFIKFGKRCFWPPGGVWGAPPYIIVRNKIPNGARQARNMLWDDDPAPFSGDKIRAKILDLGYGALHNLSPKSARILSEAITRTIMLPAGVRGLGATFTRG